MKTVLFVPGFQEDLMTRDYKSAIKAIESCGYKVQFVPIKWQRTTITHWVAELEAVYSKLDPANTVLAGFSYGSMTAFMAATKRNPSQLWLFSFSPYFADDIPKLKKSWLNNIGHRRVDAFKNLDFNMLAKQITCPTLIILGEVEAEKYPLLDRRAKLAHEKITGSTLVIAPDSDHDVGDPNYVKTIKAAIEKL